MVIIETTMASPPSSDSFSNKEIEISPLTVSTTVGATDIPPPFSTVAPPTAILDRAQIIEGIEETFPLFPFFPTEIRLKIWKANMRPQMLHIIYDTGVSSHVRGTYLHGRQYRATWRFTTSPATQMPNRFICQESRAETKKAGYQLMILRDNLTEARWYNHETDFLFFDTNAKARLQFTAGEDDYYNQYIDNVLPPVGHPIAGGSRVLQNKINTLAVSDALWSDWPFSEDNGSEASCEMCPEFHFDYTHDDFKTMVEKMQGLQKLVIVRTGNRSDGGKRAELKLEKRQPEDQYGMSLLRRLIEWKEEKGLEIEVELMQLIG